MMTLIMPDTSFVNLIERCRNGNAAAQKELYQTHYGLGMSICLRYCRTKEEAYEVLNDGFIKVFKNLDKYQTNLSFKNWFKRILINASIDFYRKEQKHYNHQDIETAYAQSSQTAAPDSSMQHGDLMQLLKDLPNSYRISFTLFAIEGYSHQEIADQLNISVGTSKSNVSRARDLLRKMLTIIDNEDTRVK